MGTMLVESLIGTDKMENQMSLNYYYGLNIK
jgi:hypothetical protein